MNIISKESYPIGLCTRVAVCFLWSMNWTFKITLDDLHSWVRDQYKSIAWSWWHERCGILYFATNLGSKPTWHNTGWNDDYECRVQWTEQRGFRASSENMLLAIDMDRGKTTKHGSRTIRRRTKTHATPIFVYSLHVHRSKSGGVSRGWKFDLTTWLDMFRPKERRQKQPLFNKTNRRTNFFQIYFCQETLDVSGISSAHHQEFSTVRSALVYVMQVWWQISSTSRMVVLEICHQTCMTYTSAERTVENSWWWTEEMPETCRVSWQK